MAHTGSSGLSTGVEDTEAMPSVIAHRGFAGVYPENTLVAIESACRDAATLELDVMPSADGEVIVFHDETPARVTDAPPTENDRNVWEFPYDRLAELEILHSGETVPRLATALDVIPSEVTVNIELKNPGTPDVCLASKLEGEQLAEARDRWLPFTERVLEVVDDHPHEVLVSSFCEGALAATRSLDSNVLLATVFWDSIEDGLAITRHHDCEFLHIPLNMVAGTALFGTDNPAPGPFEEVDLLKIARHEGWSVNAWTVRTWRQASELARAGVDGIIADYPGLLRSVPLK